MSIDASTPELESRILLRTATSKDALMSSAVMVRAGITPFVCDDTAALVRQMMQGAGALMLAEETLNGPDAQALLQALAAQPPWSDLPILVLARPGADSRVITHAMELLGNVTVIERPMRLASLISTIRTALRARHRQYELRATLKGLHEADQRKTEFLATLAHELRNPLAPMSTALALLKRKAMDKDEANKYYALMSRQVDHMARLVNDLMEVSRITRGKVDLRMASVALALAIQSAIEQTRPFFKNAGHALSVELPPQPLLVSGDAVRLTQVFSNLLNNAAKYTPAGGQIRITAREANGEAVIEISDTGVGIAPAMLGPVFEMFVQASGTAKAAQGGLGIGLTLVKSLVELHAGQVHAHSPGLGQGTTITVRLPLLARPAAVCEGEPQSPAALAVDSLSGRVILVVDDNRDAADTLCALLGSLGASTAVAYSAEEALLVADVHCPRVAILDLGMPGTDGFELARKLRRRPEGSDLTLIAMTGWGQHADRLHVTEAGFNHHLLKPMKLEELLLLI